MRNSIKAPKSKVERRVVLKKLILHELTPGQRSLIKKHGTVSDFAIACHKCVPSVISFDEAEAAVKRYQREFNMA